MKSKTRKSILIVIVCAALLCAALLLTRDKSVLPLNSSRVQEIVVGAFPEKSNFILSSQEQ